MYPTMDDQDRALIASRMAALDEREGPRVGDHVDFADGTTRRISYEWTFDDGDHGGFQTSDGGHYYLSDYGVSMSGSLYPCVPQESLEPTGETREGSVWVFHHDHHTAHNGVDTAVSFRVFRCNQEAPR